MLAVQAWRSWRSAKAVALLAATALAAGIGAATAIYTVVDSVMLKPLPYRDGDRFIALFGAATNDPEHYASLSSRDAKIYQERTGAFDAFGWFREAEKNLTFAGEPHHVQGVAVTAALVPQLGVDPSVGQWFHDDSGVVISSRLWRQLGRDPQIVGKALSLDRRSYTVTGVMPDTFRLPVVGVTAGFRADVWTALDPGEDAGAAYFVYARRRPGVTFAAAEADAKRVAAQIAAEDPVGHPAFTARVFDLRETVIEEVRPTLLLLFAAAGLLFLITCANAAGLLLARSVARARETAMRVALGARHGQLAAHYFAESLPVALAGAAGGILLSLTLTPLIVSMAADYLPGAENISVDGTVLLFALGAALTATVLSSLAPLWQAMKTAPADALSDGARASAGARTRRVSQSLVVAEIALAFALLAVSAVLIDHLGSLSRVSPGFDPDQVLTFGISVPGAIARDYDTRTVFQRQLVEGLRTIPGAGGVAFANQLPLDGCCMSTNIYPEGRPVDLTASQRMSLMAVSPDYFQVLRIPLRRGRLLTDRDMADDHVFVVIDQAVAARYWGSDDPIGRYGRFNSPTGDRFQVIGVVGDVKNDGLGNPTVPELYLLAAIANVESMHFVIRSARPPSSLVPDIRRVVRNLDPEQPIHEVATMREIVRKSLTLERAASVLTAFFAGAALLMAMLGVYGVIAYAVRQRTVEIGTRMALGAKSRDVLALIVGDGVRMAVYGVIVGGLAAVGIAFYLGRVFRIPDLGPAPFLYSTSIVGAVALVASFLPAWRATHLSPMVAIRNEPGSMWQAARSRVQSAIGGLSEADEPAAVPMGTLIAEFAESIRRAASFPEAIQVALAALRKRTGAQSITLLEKAPGDEYRCGNCAIPVRGFLLNRLRHYPHALAVTAADFDAWSRWAREFRPAHVAEIERLGNTGARLAVSLRTKHEVVGVLLLGPPEGRERYTLAERQVLNGSADVFALMIENARLTDRALEQEKLRRDLALAAEVQRRLLPPQPPSSGLVTLAAFTLPARTVGGDYYDFLDLGHARLGIGMADVSGKGIAAALLMSVVQASLRVISGEPDLSVAALAAKMNRFLYQSTGANKYATFFYAQVDGRRLRYVNAGHNPPYLVRGTGAQAVIRELSAGGTVLGLFPEVSYDETEIDLQSGDLLVAFTDGVTEALNADGEDFGEERLKALLRDGAGAPAEEISSTLAAGMREWIGSAEQHDDLTFVVMTVT